MLHGFSNLIPEHETVQKSNVVRRARELNVAPIVKLDRENEGSYVDAVVAKYRKLSPTTIYGIALALVVTVFWWAIMDLRSRVGLLENHLQMMMYRLPNMQ